jgi:hypothetical protein
VFLGESERSVADVLRDSRSSLDEYELADRSDAESWLDKYLLDNGGTAEAKTVIAAGEASGYNAKTIKNVRTKVAGTSARASARAASFTGFTARQP